jgi:hypothetical protein
MAATRIDFVNGAASTTLRLNDGTADSDGNIWNVTDFVGWGGMTPAVMSMKRMATDGNVITNASYSVRNIQVTGTVRIAAGSDIWEAIQMFETATDSVAANGKVRVYEPAGTRHALVRLNGQPAISRNRNSQHALNWAVAFTAHAPALIAGA